jgi:hypothetical protein
MRFSRRLRYTLIFSVLLLFIGWMVGLRRLFLSLPSFNVVHHAISTPKCQLELRTSRIRRMVVRACTIFNEYNITYFLMDGTLLGALHGGDILPTDGDGDIGYFWVDNVIVKRRLGAKFILKTKTFPIASVDLKRFEVKDNVLVRVNAPHESSIVDWAVAKYNSVWRYDDVFPLREVGGEGPLKHCKIPYHSEELMEEMFGEFIPVKCLSDYSVD